MLSPVETKPPQTTALPQLLSCQLNVEGLRRGTPLFLSRNEADYSCCINKVLLDYEHMKGSWLSLASVLDDTL